FFYQSVSHGLKTPIMVIQNCCAAYQDGNYGSEAIDIIMKESLAVEAGIRKLLYVSSFDHMLGKQSDFRPVELRGLMQECRRRFRGNERGIRLEVDVPAGLTVSGNEAALQTVFDNLVENGLRYAASYIRMELTGEEEGGYLLT
ncbi:sensor histidine kinase, partial [Flavonifractor plautii]|nr:sensor histidine kinase [Flavonifractor plautii]